MKKQLLSLGLVLCFALSSCASMLNRSYSSVTAHVDKPTTAEDPSVLRVENYRDLVSAVLYLVNQGAETGTIRLYEYPGEVAGDLARACAEVATQDPLAAYAVDYIRHESARVVSYYEAKLEIHYRRTMEQVRSMVNVTGTGAIRAELQRALNEFDPEVVLRVGYFSQDEASIAELIRQTYQDDPITLVGLPQAEINLYPETGRERVVEVLLTWPESAEAIQNKRDRLRRMVDETNGSLELVEVSRGLSDEAQESRFLLRLAPNEGESLYYDPLGEDEIHTWAELEDLGYRLPESIEVAGVTETGEETPLQSENP